MVTRRLISRFADERDGLSLTEGLIVFPLMVLAISVCVEFAYVTYQWNAAAKAMQLGVRKLLVSDAVSPDFDAVFDAYKTGGGNLVNADAAVTSTCGGGGPACTTGINRIINGTSASGYYWPGLANFFPGLQASEVRVTYTLNGLGYQGRPGGAVVTVRLEIVRDRTDTPVVGALLGFAGISFPSFSVTATSEDLEG